MELDFFPTFAFFWIIFNHLNFRTIEIQNMGHIFNFTKKILFESLCLQENEDIEDKLGKKNKEIHDCSTGQQCIKFHIADYLGF